MASDDDLERRLASSDLMRPIVAEWILDESQTSYECLLLVAEAIRLMNQSPSNEAIMTAAIKQARRECTDTDGIAK